MNEATTWRAGGRSEQCGEKASRCHQLILTMVVGRWRRFLHTEVTGRILSRGRMELRDESGRGCCSSLRGIFPPRMTLARGQRALGEEGSTDVDIGDFFSLQVLTLEQTTPEIRKPLAERLHDQGWTTTGNPVIPELFQYFEMSNTNDDRVRTGWQFEPAIFLFHINRQSRLACFSNGICCRPSHPYLFRLSFQLQDCNPRSFETGELKL